MAGINQLSDVASGRADARSTIAAGRPAAGGLPPSPRIEDQHQDMDRGIFRMPTAPGTATLDFDRNTIDPRDMDADRANTRIRPSQLDEARAKADRDLRAGRLNRRDYDQVIDRIDQMLQQVRPGT